MAQTSCDQTGLQARTAWRSAGSKGPEEGDGDDSEGQAEWRHSAQQGKWARAPGHCPGRTRPRAESDLKSPRTGRERAPGPGALRVFQPAPWCGLCAAVGRHLPPSRSVPQMPPTRSSQQTCGREWRWEWLLTGNKVLQKKL